MDGFAGANRDRAVVSGRGGRRSASIGRVVNRGARSRVGEGHALRRGICPGSRRKGRCYRRTLGPANVVVIVAATTAATGKRRQQDCAAKKNRVSVNS